MNAGHREAWTTVIAGSSAELCRNESVYQEDRQCNTGLDGKTT